MRGLMQRKHAPRLTSSATRARSIAHSPARDTHGTGIAGAVLDLQQTIGNQAVGRVLQRRPTSEGTHSAASRTGPARTGLTISTPGDAFEREADRVADRVTTSASEAGGRAASLPAQRVSAPSHGQSGAAPASVGQTLVGAGRPLDAALRQDMERRLGHDFSHVRVHTGASAEQSARDVDATAYTVGDNVVFGRNRFAPETLEGRGLIAHELTHVVQQSRSSMFQTPAAPAVVQRKKDDPAQKKEAPAKKKEDPARKKVLEAMEALKKKWGLAEVGEENEAKWSESELKKVDAAFSMLDPADKDFLKSVHLIRTDKFEPLVIEDKTPQADPKKKKKSKTFQIAGKTSESGRIRLAAGAFRGGVNTVLHEVGHHVQHQVAAAMLKKSKQKLDLETARTAMAAIQRKEGVGSGTEVNALISAMNRVNSAASALEGSDEETRAAKQSELQVAKEAADAARMAVETLPTNAPGNAAGVLKVHDAQIVFVEAVERFAVERDKKNLTEFIAIINKNNLAQRKYRPFRDYIAAQWPDKPWEYFAESFRAWRTDRDYMKANMKPLFDFFEKGGHRVK